MNIWKHYINIELKQRQESPLRDPEEPTPSKSSLSGCKSNFPQTIPQQPNTPQTISTGVKKKTLSEASVSDVLLNLGGKILFSMVRSATRTQNVGKGERLKAMCFSFIGSHLPRRQHATKLHCTLLPVHSQLNINHNPLKPASIRARTLLRAS